MPVKPPCWTPEEDRIVREGFTAGLDDRAIAIRLRRRSELAVRQRRKFLHLQRQRQRSRDYFSPEDDARLVRASAEGKSRREAAALFKDKSYSTVANRARHLGLVFAAPKGRWAPDEIAILEKSLAEGLSSHAIQRRLPGRTLMAITGQMTRLHVDFVEVHRAREAAEAADAAFAAAMAKAGQRFADDARASRKGGGPRFLRAEPNASAASPLVAAIV